jgi:starch synthase
MVGRPTGQKGWDYVAAALEKLNPTLAAQIELTLIGGLGQGQGPYSSYSSRVAAQFDALIHPTIFNLGALPHTEVLAHLVAADLLLFPSVFEPLGLVLLEAMAAGCCVLASDAAGPADLLEAPWGHQMAFSDPERRVAAIIEGLEVFLRTQPTERAQHQLSAIAAARAHSWDHCARVHLDALLRP